MTVLKRIRSDSLARQEARSLGLKYHGWGYWGSNTEITHHTVNGRLEKLEEPKVASDKPKYERFETGIYKTKIPLTTNAHLIREKSVEDAKTFTKEEHEQLHNYISSSIVENMYLSGAVGHSITDSVKKRIEIMDSLLNKTSLAADATLYRGLATPQGIEFWEKLVKDQTIVIAPVFLSTSLSPDVAKRFTTHDTKYFFIIKAKKGQKGLAMSPEVIREGKPDAEHGEFLYDASRGELEVILPRDTKLKIIRVEKWNKEHRSKKGKLWMVEKNARIIAEIV